MVTLRSRAALRVTDTVTVSPSSTSYVAEPKLTATAGSSSSVMETTVSLGLPSVTPVGRVPNPSFTLSPSSSSPSWVAVKGMLFSVSPDANSTLAGTPE